jgi:arylsulfatase A-like enzyme
MKSEYNLLIIHCHDLGKHLGCYGVNGVQTPHIDAFARDGIRFDRAFATAPQCSPSRASMYTGTYPEENGVMGLCNANMGWDLYPEVEHIGQILGKSGFFTFGCGIIHETLGGPERCGLQHYHRAQDHLQLPTAFEEAIDIAVAKEQPFFGQVGFFAPHRRPLDWSDKATDQGFLEPDMVVDPAEAVDVPPYLQDTVGTREELAELQTAIRYMDTAFGELMACLDRHHLRDKTLIVFTTDHGIAMPRAKCSLYDPGIGIALLMQIPHSNGPSHTYPHLFSNVDLTSTLLNLLRIPAPAACSGIVHTPESPGLPPREAAFASLTFHDYYFPMRGIRTDNYKLIVNFSNTHAFMDPSQSWYHRSATTTPPNNNRSKSPLIELYDLQADPWEQHNIAELPETAPLRADLLAALAAHMRRTGDPLPERGFPSPRHLQACALLGFNP